MVVDEYVDREVIKAADREVIKVVDKEVINVADKFSTCVLVRRKRRIPLTTRIWTHSCG